MEDLKIKILKKLKKLEKEFNYKYTYKVSFNLKSSRIMGQYDGSEDILYFNIDVAMNAGYERYEEVIVHEFGHLIARYKYAFTINPHRKEWRSIMKKLKAKRIAATIDLSEYVDGRTKVKCKCQSYYFTKNRLTRLRNGTKYRCQSCGKKIKEIK